MATVRDIAREASVSVGTVSNYINGKHVSKERSRRIQLAIDRLNFGIKSLDTKSSVKNVHILVNNLTSMYCSAVSEKLLYELNFHEFCVHMHVFNDDERLYEKYLKKISSLDANYSLIIINGLVNSSSNYLLVELGVPVISINSIYENKNIVNITSNCRSTSKKVIQHLFSKGYKNIGVIYGPQENNFSY